VVPTEWFDNSSNPNERPSASKASAAFLLILVAAIAAARFGIVEGSPLFCPFHRLTGLLCPLCGITRAWVALIHGEILAALRWHPFVVLIIPILSGAALGWRPSSAMCRGGLIALVSFGILRIAIHTL
jgi:hypothetical protein